MMDAACRRKISRMKSFVALIAHYISEASATKPKTCSQFATEDLEGILSPTISEIRVVIGRFERARYQK